MQDRIVTLIKAFAVIGGILLVLGLCVVTAYFINHIPICEVC